MKIEPRRFKVVIRCSDCGNELNSTVPLGWEEVYDAWGQLALSSGLVSGKCKNGCRSTWSDCNINTRMIVVDGETGKDLDFATLKLLSGRFYSESHADVCACPERPDDEVYESEKYPSVHGRCGKFVAAYVRR